MPARGVPGVPATDGYMRYFPYEEPYTNQPEAMDRIANALARGQDVLFEGACGTGKTLSALLPALDYARETDRTVVITTNVHQQMRQFVRDARAINETEPVRAVVFRGKGSMCHIDVGYEECQVLRDNTHDLVELEQDIADLERRQRELLEAAQAGDDEAAASRASVMNELEALEEQREALEENPTCDHYYRNLTSDTTPFQSWLDADVRRPDEIYARAERDGQCGYELLKESMEGVDLAVCNYQHLLQPGIREQFFRWLGCDPDDVITVFDEAHNVESTARENATRTLSERTLDSAIAELEDVVDPRTDGAAAVFRAYRDGLRTCYDGAVSPRDVGHDWTDVTIDAEQGDHLTRSFLSSYAGHNAEEDIEAAIELGVELDRRYERAYQEGDADTREESAVLQAAAFVDDWLGDAARQAYYPVVSVRRHEATDELYGRAELYACLPREVAGSLFETVHASILMSATLRPFSILADVLGLHDPVELAYGLSFPEARRRTFVVDGPALFSRNREDREVQSVVTGALRDAIRMTPGNTLVYFPSYGEAERYHELLDDIEATRYLDQPATRADELRREFTDASHAALFTSVWGTLTEGVSFDGDDARTVVVVGVPYPYLDDRLEAVMDAYAAEFGSREHDAGWRYAVEIPTIRKTRQALGRVLRSPEDYGTRILLDHRYTTDATVDMGEYAVRETFPPEEREEMIDIAPDRLRYAMSNFFRDLDAYEGEPPDPDR